MDPVLSYVAVSVLPQGQATFAICTADVFDPDELTVSSTDAETDQYGPVRVFTSGSWVDAIVYDPQGNVQFVFVSAVGRQMEQARQVALRRKAS